MRALATCVALAIGLIFATTPSSAATNDDEGVEMIEEFVVIEEVENETNFTLSMIVGRMHAAMVHFPIAWLPILILFEFFVLMKGWPEWWLEGRWLCLATLAAFLPAVVSGMLRLNELSHGAERLQTAINHRNVMLAAAILVASAAGLRFARRELGSLKHLYLALLIASFAFVAVGGHLGAVLVYGEDFLPF
jgi:uncharacterized membrane protein